MSEFLEAALAYAARGWSVVPCHSPSPGGCTCKAGAACSSPGKHPRVVRGLHAASRSCDLITRWWTRWATANIGIRTGAPSGLVVVDIDPRHGGDATHQRLSRRGWLPSTLTALSGGGGVHLYYAHPGGTIRNDAGRRVGRGIDVRGDGGLIIAPPSRHPSGGRYEWAAGAREPAVMSDWLGQRLQPREREWAPPDVRGISDEAAEQALSRAVSEIASAVEGTRNNTLNRTAFRVGRLLGPSLREADARAALVSAALRTGLSEREATATVSGALAAGRRAIPLRQQDRRSPSFGADVAGP